MLLDNLLAPPCLGEALRRGGVVCVEFCFEVLMEWFTFREIAINGRRPEGRPAAERLQVIYRMKK